MNRRKAILRISLAGAAVIAAGGGYKWHALTKTPDFKYLEQHREMITALAETIIPATDTPGAREAGVGDFIIAMVKDCAPLKDQNKFIDGLKDLSAYCDAQYDKAYQHCTAQQQESVLAHFEKKGKPYSGIAGKVQSRYLGNSFFTILKQYTVEGYCTSQAGATKGLAYLYVPGRYEGCITLQPGQKAWATN